MRNGRPDAEPVPSQGLTPNGLYINSETLPQPQLGAIIKMLTESFKKQGARLSGANPAIYQLSGAHNTSLICNGEISCITMGTLTLPGREPAYQLEVRGKGISPKFPPQSNNAAAVRLALCELTAFQTGRFPQDEYDDLRRIQSYPKPPIR